MKDQFVVCVENEGLPASLERFKIYRALIDEEASRAGLLRVVDEAGEDYLFPSRMFTPIDVPQSVAHALRQTG